MEEKHEVDKIDDVMLPGFRFHPTDEELVGFYLKRKIQQRPLPIELIKQVDIYKYDPWDLPKFATTGEKEWYFYCPRDRKYRNSARPNRVTGAGFWKATGTDRPIYSADGTKCMGLKKSLVFYRGRAAKGIKTDWMMHEFRLPPLAEPSPPPKKLLDKSLPPNDAWAICRIFKKTNSMAQRALNHSWISHLQDTALPTDIINHGSECAQFSSENISCTTEIGSVFQICSNNDLQQQQQPSSSSATFSALDMSSYKPMNSTMDKPSIYPVSNGDVSNNWMFSPLNPALDFEGSQQQQFSGFCVSLGEDAQADHKNQTGIHHDNNQVEWGNIRSIGFPFSLPSNSPDAWDSPPCPSEISSTYSTNKCYT